MSGAGFHVHGPHDHELEHAAQGAHDAHGVGGGMINQIAMFTAIIATVGAIFAYMGGATQANAGLFKNNAAIKKTEASNQWNYFQSKSTKQSLAEVSRDLSPEDEQGVYQAKIDRYEKEKKDIKVDAEGSRSSPRTGTSRADEQMHQHHRWAQATTVLQVSIAPGGHRPAHPQEVAGVRHVRGRRRRRRRRRAGDAARLKFNPGERDDAWTSDDRRLPVRLMSAALLAPALAAATRSQPPGRGTPSATLDVASEQMRLIYGGTAGKGVLHFNGQDYPFSFKSASVGLGAKVVTKMQRRRQRVRPDAYRGLRRRIHVDQPGDHGRIDHGHGDLQERQGRLARPARHGRGRGALPRRCLATVALVKK